jgi:hypothetical protein
MPQTCSHTETRPASAGQHPLDRSRRSSSAEISSRTFAIGVIRLERTAGWPEAGVEGSGKNRDGSFFRLGADLAVGCAAPRRMDHGLVAFAAKLRQQPPQLPLAEARLLGVCRWV